MKIGIVSDLHGKLPETAVKALQGVDRIICAGDVVREPLLWELQTVAPVICVMGNNDYGRIDAPFWASPTIGGVKFLIVHRPEDVGVPAPDVQVVVHGHTHIPRDQQIGKVRYVNPGSTTRPRGGSDPSIALMTIENGAVTDVRFVTV